MSTTNLWKLFVETLEENDEFYAEEREEVAGTEEEMFLPPHLEVLSKSEDSIMVRIWDLGIELGTATFCMKPAEPPFRGYYLAIETLNLRRAIALDCLSCIFDMLYAHFDDAFHQSYGPLHGTEGGIDDLGNNRQG